MIAEFSIVPLGEGSSVGSRIAEALDIVDRSGLPYKINPMGTVVEGDWDEVMGIVRQCHDALMRHAPRLITTIRVDDRKGVSGMMERKVKSVEEKLGRDLNK
jgi:uncharacterized protein (TIGR00106 family)